jgi:hypothetical protein
MCLSLFAKPTFAVTNVNLFFCLLMDYIIGELFRYSLFKLGTTMASRVVMFLPRNVDVNQVAEMSLSVDPPWAVEASPFLLILCQTDFSKTCHNGLPLCPCRSRRTSSMES